MTFRADAAQFIVETSPLFKLHLFMGMSIFVIFPFTRLVPYLERIRCGDLSEPRLQLVRTR